MYLVAKNHILRDQIKGRVQLSDTERQTLAEIGVELGKQVLEAVATIVQPDTIWGWQRKLVAEKFGGSKQRKYPGTAPRRQGNPGLGRQDAKENCSWGCDRIAGALAELGLDNPYVDRPLEADATIRL